MKFDDILRLQDYIKSWLEKNNITPYSVYITLEVPMHSQGLCSISFFNNEQVKEFLSLMEYDVQCSKSDYTILDTNTVFVTGLALIKLYNSLI